MSATAYIYALVNRRTFRVDYVGKTIHPHTRHWDKLKSYGISILRSIQNDCALRIEAQVIRAFKRRGECRKNILSGQLARMGSLRDEMRNARNCAEREVLESALKKAPKLRNGSPNLTSVADSLGWSRVTVYEKLKLHGYIALFDIDERIKVVLYGNGAVVTRDGQESDTFPKLKSDLLKGMKSFAITEAY